MEAHVAHGAVPDVDHVFPASHSNDEGDGDDAEDGGDGAGAVVEDGDGDDAEDGGEGAGAVGEHVSAAQSVSYLVAVKALLLFHASAILRLLHVVRDVVKRKVRSMLDTLAMSHASIPVPVNLAAPANVFSSVVTFPTFHPVRSAFISLAP